MSIKLGLNNIGDIKAGTTNIIKVMGGSNVLWEKLTYEAETLAYQSMVEADGGTVIDIDYVDSIYKLLKARSIYDKLKVWVSANAGVKTLSGKVAKMYSLDPIGNHVNQTIDSDRPNLVDATLNSARKTVEYSGAQIMFADLASTHVSSNYSLIDFTMLYGSAYRETKQGLTESGGLTYQGVEVGFWPTGRIVYYNGNGTSYLENVFSTPNTLSAYTYTSMKRFGSSMYMRFNETTATDNLSASYTIDPDRLVLGSRQHNALGNTLNGEMFDNIYFRTRITDVDDVAIKDLMEAYYN